MVGTAVLSIPADINWRIAIWTKRISNTSKFETLGQAHLRSGVLAGNSLEGGEGWCQWRLQLIRGETEAHVWAQLKIAHATSDVLVVGVVQVTVEDLLGQGKRTF